MKKVIGPVDTVRRKVKSQNRNAAIGGSKPACKMQRTVRILTTIESSTAKQKQYFF